MHFPIIDNKTACVILAGGKSERMGIHKALLPYSENESFLQHIIDIYRSAGVKKIIVVLNADIELPFDDFDYKGIRLIKNYFHENGRLFSLQLGISILAGSSYTFIQNIDNPFVTVDLIKRLYTSRLNADYITPVYKTKGGHPLIISSKIIEYLAKLKTYNKTLRDTLEKFSRAQIEGDEKCQLNINSPIEYQNIFGNTKLSMSL